MLALVGVAAQGDGASRRVGHGARLLAQHCDVLAVSRPWHAPAGDGGPPGVLAVAHAELGLPHQEVRPWLWELEGDGSLRQFELLAGRHQGRWRWSLDLGRDGAWMGPLADVVPDLPLPDKRTAEDHALHDPHPGARPWSEDGRPPPARRPAGYTALRIGRTWEVRGEVPLPPRAPTYLP